MGIFGQGFVAGALVLILLGGGELVNAGAGSVAYILMMTGRSKIILLNSSILCVLNISLNYMLIPRYGIIGAGIATGLSIALIYILRLAEVYYFLKIHPYKLTFLKPCAAGFLSFFLFYFITTKLSPITIFNSAILALFFISLYFFLIYLLKLDEEDKYILKSAYQKIINLKSRISSKYSA
jgi:O-antigen/teichoic acid export membrane protein